MLRSLSQSLKNDVTDHMDYTHCLSMGKFCHSTTCVLCRLKPKIECIPEDAHLFKQCFFEKEKCVS